MTRDLSRLKAKAEVKRKLKMRDISDLIVTYLVKLKNSGMTSIYPQEISLYLSTIGLKGCKDNIDFLVKNKTIIPLKNGKVTLNWVKLKKTRKSRN